jgi:hypothetical protein
MPLPTVSSSRQQVTLTLYRSTRTYDSVIILNQTVSNFENDWTICPNKSTWCNNRSYESILLEMNPALKCTFALVDHKNLYQPNLYSFI